MTGSKRMKHYDEEFKRKAVELVTVAGKKASVVERELGIYQGAIRSWINAFEKNSGTAKSDSEELRRLKRELEEARMENEILKKAMGYFARSQR